nr:unnamed protein product [Callosobruchus analis]
MDPPPPGGGGTGEKTRNNVMVYDLTYGIGDVNSVNTDCERNEDQQQQPWAEIEHSTLSKTCPQFAKQKAIKNFMVRNNATFMDAKTSIERSYASISSTNPFSVLQNLNSNENFPSLPSRNMERRTPFYSQPSRPSIACHSSNKENAASKKRKASSPPAATPVTAPIFVSVYRAPQVRTNTNFWIHLLKSFEGPCLIGGDFNGHHHVWGSPKMTQWGNNYLRL